MSVPPSMSLDPEVSPATMTTASGDLAALVGEPPAAARRAGPVLLVPGYTGSKEDFLPILGPLARAGHRAVAIDLRGQYQSTGPDDPAAYTIEAHAKDVADVLAGLGPGAHLVGHSFGGLVTRRAVIGGARPATHVLVGSGPAALPGRRAATIPLMLEVVAESGAEGYANAVTEMERGDPRMADVPEEVRRFLHERRMLGSGVALRVMGEQILSVPDEVAELAAAGVRTLVVYGAADDAWPPELQAEMAARLGAEAIGIEGSAHSPACEQPQAFVEVLLRFWQG
ncbi:MAG TPA: alpha/beta hydrolase [Mycobacteriales bacterium]|nr:alpha/beta hydrolase [Mycobacteriales bacterium]